MRTIFAVLITALAIVTTPVAAQAADDDWWFAESSRFKVYSSGGEEAARDMATKLERVDDAMRMYTGIAPIAEEIPDVSKVTLYQFGETDDIGDLAGSPGVAGFFIPRAGNSVAFVPLEEGRRSRNSGSVGTRDKWEFYDFSLAPERVLFHEYAHYFMFQHAAAAYPSWYIEGLAELFGMLRLTEAGFALGDPPSHREGEISLYRIDTDMMFVSNSKIVRYVEYPVYGHGWLLTSYLSFAPERSGQLATFLKLLNQGVDTPDAAEQAFGDLKQLEDELNDYRKQRVRGIEVKFPELSEPAIEARPLSADEAARMPIMIKSSAGVRRSNAGGILSDARAIAERFPDSVPVQRALMEAQFDAGEYADAAKTADRLLDTDEAVDANLYKAWTALEFAKEDKGWLSTARSSFIAANRLDPNEPNALTGYYLTFLFAGEEPPENALIALERAFEIAPFDSTIRVALAHLLLLENRDKAALTVLAPVIYQPHGSKELIELRDLVEKLENGDRQPLIDKLEPKLVDEE